MIRIALLGAMTMLMLCDVKNIDEILHKVEWSTLVFFAALFVLMHGMEELGLITYIGESASDIIRNIPADYRLAAALSIIVWVSGVASAFIDNIPFVAAMIPVCIAMAQDKELELPLFPLIYALAFGACLGGNGTIVGASANVVTVGMLESAGYHVSFVEFLKFGMPVMALSLFISNIYILIVCVGFGYGNNHDMKLSVGSNNVLCA